MNEFRMQHVMVGSIEVIRLTGSLDMYSFPNLESHLTNQFQHGCCSAVLDCRELDYICSVGLGTLIGLSKQFRENGGDVKLFGVPDRIYKIIELLGFAKMLRVYDNEDDALAGFGGGQAVGSAEGSGHGHDQA